MAKTRKIRGVDPWLNQGRHYEPNPGQMCCPLKERPSKFMKNIRKGAYGFFISKKLKTLTSSNFGETRVKYLLSSQTIKLFLPRFKT